jgi:non-canonical purine NTP pyrophosphatase (RdgB/HAM1 family)
MNVVFVTGNQNKAKYFSKLIGMTIEHHAANVNEIQNLDLIEVATHKAKEAYKQLERPVLVEDTGLKISCMGNLPGPFIKWFIQEIGLDGICKIVNQSQDRSARASDAFVYYDGLNLCTFTGSLDGQISAEPRGGGGYDWDKIFVPEGSKLTNAELTEEEYEKVHLKIKPITELREFLLSLDKA